MKKIKKIVCALIVYFIQKYITERLYVLNWSKHVTRIFRKYLEEKMRKICKRMHGQKSAENAIKFSQKLLFLMNNSKYFITTS